MGAGGPPTRVWVGRQHSGRHFIVLGGCGSPGGARRLGRRLGTALLLAGLVVVFLGAVRQRMPYNPTTVLGRLGGAPPAPAAEEPASPGLLSSLATAYEEARHKIGMCTEQECEAALRRGGRPLVFFNTPAGGGDGVCRAARANGERMEPAADQLVPPAGLPAPFSAAGGGECPAPPADVARPLAVQSPYLQDVALGRAFGEAYRLTFLAPGGQVSGLGFDPQTPLVAFTLLRDPRARWAAEFRSQPPAALAARLGLDHAPSLQEYLELETADGAAHDNLYVRFFLGLRDAAVPLTQRHLERAKAVLSGLDAVLVAERLAESGCLLRNFGWTAAAEGLGNTPDDGGGGGAGGLLHRLTRWDQELYQHAVQLFQDQLARCECCRYYEPGGGEAALPTPVGSPEGKGG